MAHNTRKGAAVPTNEGNSLSCDQQQELIRLQMEAEERKAHNAREAAAAEDRKAQAEDRTAQAAREAADTGGSESSFATGIPRNRCQKDVATF